MKIKKFNESNSQGLDIQYLKFIFSDFLDEGAYFFVLGAEGFNRDGQELLDTDEIEEYYEIFIKEPMLKRTSMFDYYENNIKEIHDFSNNLKSCIDKVKDEYPDIKITFDFEDIQVDRQGMIQREIHLIFTL